MNGLGPRRRRSAVAACVGPQRGRDPNFMAEGLGAGGSTEYKVRGVSKTMQIEKDRRKTARSGAAPGIFAWLSPAVRNARGSSWLVLLVDDASLRSMGQAGFIAASLSLSLRDFIRRKADVGRRLVAVLLPPSLALSVFILASLTLLLGARC
ncbi:hypothetical protein C8R47DRAFT_1065103 [Mycena vitilis]|nr:hypothetical protein C8R47DRAFT_1065103 [Mycena vitilis]